MEITFERAALYGEVWSTPLTKLGKKYGMSDNGIRKVCKAMNIPLPSVGHWARVEAGQTVTRKGLPPDAERTTFVSRSPPDNSAFKAPEDASWLATRLSSEVKPQLAIVFEETPTHWHPKLKTIRAELAKSAKNITRLIQQKAALKSRKAKQPSPNWDAIAHPNLEQGLLTWKHHRNPLVVSYLTYERALAIANCLFFAAEKRGFLVDVDTSKGRLVLQMEGVQIGMAIRERQDFEMGLSIPSIPAFGESRKFRPTDRLAIVVDQGASFQLLDGEASRVESRLGEFFPKLYRAIVRGKVSNRQNVAAADLRAQQWAAYEELTRKRAVEAAAKAEQLKRQNELLAEASSWRQAQDIRTYIAHVISRPGSDLPGIKEWSEWALRVAESMDPVTKKVPTDAAFHKERQHADADPTPASE